MICAGLKIVDHDVNDWQSRRDDDDAEEVGEEAPVVENASKEAEQLRASVGIREDGSGWLPASPSPFAPSQAAH